MMVIYHSVSTIPLEIHLKISKIITGEISVVRVIVVVVIVVENVPAMIDVLEIHLVIINYLMPTDDVDIAVIVMN